MITVSDPLANVSLSSSDKITVSVTNRSDTLFASYQNGQGTICVDRIIVDTSRYVEKPSIECYEAAANSGVFVGSLPLITGVEERGQFLPRTYELSQNYPNPFNPYTRINYSVPGRSHIIVTVYNVLGQKVSTIVDAIRERGTYSATFDARNIASGVYFYRLEGFDLSGRTGTQFLVKKMLVVK